MSARVSGGADISSCGAFRYRLWRDVPADPPRVAGGTALFVMLNPSKADATEDDPTIRRCIGFSRAWGFSLLVVVNLFAYRATDPREMARLYGLGEDIVGPLNDDFILDEGRAADLIVLAWGRPRWPWVRSRAGEVGKILESVRPKKPALYCLRKTNQGHPAHPLYLPGSLRPEPWFW